MEKISLEQQKAIRDCIDIWHQVYPCATADDGMLAYKYFANPISFKHPLRVMADEKGPITCIGYTALSVVRGQERFVAGQGGDAMSIPGRSGMNFARLCRDEAAYLQQQGADMHLGNPNAHSLPFVLRFGGRLVAQFKALQRAAPSRNAAYSAPDMSIEISQTNPLLQADCERINKTCDRYRIERTPDYYRWRFEGQSDKEFCYAVARGKAGRLEAFAIAMARPWGTCELVDWDTPNQETASACLGAILDAIQCEYAASLWAFCLNEAAGEVDLFEHLGFEVARDDAGEPISMNFTVKPVAQNVSTDILSGANWKLTQSDFDHFMN